MTTRKISELQPVNDVNNDASLVLVQEGATYRVTYEVLLNAVRANDWVTLNATLNDPESTFGKSLLPNANSVHNLGSALQRWNDLYLSGSTIYIGEANIRTEGTALVFSSGARVEDVDILANDWATYRTLTQNIYATWSNLNANDYLTWLNLDASLRANDYLTWSALNENSYATWSNLNQNLYWTWSNLNENSYATWSNLNQNLYATWSNLSENIYATWSNLSENLYATWSNLNANDYMTWSNLSENIYATWSNLNANDYMTWSNLSENIYATWSNLNQNLYATWSNLNENSYATWSNLNENSYATWSNLSENSYWTWSNLSENSYATWSNLSENSYWTWSNLNENSYATWSNLSENLYATWSNLSENSYATWSNLNQNLYATWSNLSENSYATWTNAVAAAHSNDWVTFNAILNNATTQFTADKTFLANIYLFGNLFVFGNTFQANVGTLLVQDNIINLNFGGTTVTAENSGIHVEGDNHTIVGSLHYYSTSRSGWRIGSGDLTVSSGPGDDVARFADMHSNDYATWSNLSENSYWTWSNLSENIYATWSNLSENSYATWSNLSENSYATWSNLSENLYATWSNLSENLYATWSNLQVSYRLHGNVISLGTSNLDFVGVGVNVYFTDGNLTVNISGGASTEEAFANDYATWSNLISNSAVYITDNVVPTLGEGFLWWNAADGMLYIRYVDGDSAQWVPAMSVGGGVSDSSKALAQNDSSTSKLYPLFVDSFGGIPQTIKTNSQIYYNTITSTFTVSNIQSLAVTEVSRISGLVNKVDISAQGIQGTINFDAQNYTEKFLTSNSVANCTINFRANSSISLNNLIRVGESLEAKVFVTQGSTLYYANQVSIDGTLKSVKWKNGAIGASSASAIDLYRYNILKTADETFTVIGSRDLYS